jgi:hypothetical protein
VEAHDAGNKFLFAASDVIFTSDLATLLDRVERAHPAKQIDVRKLPLRRLAFMSKTIRRGRSTQGENVGAGNVPPVGSLAEGKHERAQHEPRVTRYSTAEGYTLWTVVQFTFIKCTLCNHCVATTDYVYMDGADYVAGDEQREAFRCSSCLCGIDDFGGRLPAT